MDDGRARGKESPSVCSSIHPSIHSVAIFRAVCEIPFFFFSKGYMHRTHNVFASTRNCDLNRATTKRKRIRFKTVEFSHSLSSCLYVCALGCGCSAAAVPHDVCRWMPNTSMKQCGPGVDMTRSCRLCWRKRRWRREASVGDSRRFFPFALNNFPTEEKHHNNNNNNDDSMHSGIEWVVGISLLLVPACTDTVCIVMWNTVPFNAKEFFGEFVARTKYSQQNYHSLLSACRVCIDLPSCSQFTESHIHTER